MSSFTNVEHHREWFPTKMSTGPRQVPSSVPYPSKGIYIIGGQQLNTPVEVKSQLFSPADAAKITSIVKNFKGAWVVHFADRETMLEVLKHSPATEVSEKFPKGVRMAEYRTPISRGGDFGASGPGSGQARPSQRAGGVEQADDQRLSPPNALSAALEPSKAIFILGGNKLDTAVDVFAQVFSPEDAAKVTNIKKNFKGAWIAYFADRETMQEVLKHGPAKDATEKIKGIRFHEYRAPLFGLHNEVSTSNGPSQRRDGAEAEGSRTASGKLPKVPLHPARTSGKSEGDAVDGESTWESSPATVIKKSIWDSDWASTPAKMYRKSEWDTSPVISPDRGFRSPPLASPPLPPSAMGRHQHYSPMALRQIGELCSGKLPPASAVQAMFLYEMQRETEVESLFQGQMFKLARAEATIDDHETRLWNLEEDIKTMRKQLESKDVAERVANSKMRIEAQQTKLNALSSDVRKQAERIEELTGGLKTLKEERDECPPAAVAAMDAAITKDVADLKADTDVLFDERDELVKLLGATNDRIDKLEEMVQLLTLQQPLPPKNNTASNDLLINFTQQQPTASVSDRISKLEDLVRVLTLQKSGSSSPATSAFPSPVQTKSQTLPVQTSNGRPAAISVPKGGGLGLLGANAKENRAPIRSFVPGKPWAA